MKFLLAVAAMLPVLAILVFTATALMQRDEDR